MDFYEKMHKFAMLEEKVKIREDRKAYKVLKKFMKVVGKEEIKKAFMYGSVINSLLKVYFNFAGTETGRILEHILMENGFNLSPSIHNSIYHLLGHEEEYKDIRVNPAKFVGVNFIRNNGVQHTLYTKVGKIEVYNATKIFRNDKSRIVFDLPLPRQCYARTYDYVRMNPNTSKAVLMYMPNFFYEGHYHAFIERDNDVIDIAANAYYDSLEEASKVLDGKLIGKYTYDEIEECCNSLGSNQFEDSSKIYVFIAQKTIK